jgi:dTDP-4-amino-4,6-dideoxygalactose transaminase
MIETNKVPFLDLVTPHRELRDELLQVFNSALDTAGFIGGAAVEGFEREFAAFCDTAHCVGVASGTDAVRFALMAAGVPKDSIVVTVPNTFIATTEAITQAGARPEFVDIDERTYNMSPERLRQFLEEQCFLDSSSGHLIHRRSGQVVSAIVPVHLYGQPADMDPILELAERYELIVVEDACQAHGAEYFSRREQRWRKAGSMGTAAAFSFYPGKNLGACGEGGAVTTSDPEMARKIRMLRDHGQSRKYYHDIEGYNGRLDAIQAGLLHKKLMHLKSWNEQRRLKAAEYNRLLSQADAFGLPHEPSWTRSVYHLYVIRNSDRAGLMKHLDENGIASAIHYPVPLHLQKAYAGLNYSAGAFPVAERVATEIVSLPMFPHLATAQQARVAEAVLAFGAKQQRDLAAVGSEPLKARQTVA